VLKPQVAHLVVCNPRKTLNESNQKSDRIDSRTLAELWRGSHLKLVYHGCLWSH